MLFNQYTLNVLHRRRSLLVPAGEAVLQVRDGLGQHRLSLLVVGHLHVQLLHPLLGQRERLLLLLERFLQLLARGLLHVQRRQQLLQLQILAHAVQRLLVLL